MHGSHRCYGELAKLTVDDIRWIADAGELRRLARSGQGTLDLGAEDDDGLSQQACTALT